VRLHDLLDGLDVLGRRAWADVDVDAVVSDSRQVSPGALFACVTGAEQDGHDYARDAVQRGAVALLVERFVDADVPQAQVRSVRPVVGRIAARCNGEPSQHLRVLGVTGTNGKTTTTYLLDQIARAAGVIPGLVGTIETRIGDESWPPEHTTPDAAELQSLLARMRAAGVDTVAMEVSSHALDQYRVDGTHFAAACFTNLSHDHLDYHRTLESYFEAKARLFTQPFTAHAAINVDDAHGALLVERARNAGLQVLTYSARHGELHATDVVLARDLTRMVLHWPDGSSTSLTTQLVGEFNVENAVAAAATARLAGFEPDVIAAGLAAPLTVPGRMERIEAGQPFVVLVDYAHTPDALEQVLLASRALTGPGGRVVVVYGCGGDRDRDKRPKMGSVAARGADLAFLTTDNPRSEAPAAIIDDVLRGVGASTPTVEPDRRDAIRRALGSAHSGDVVVIAGKGHETGQTANDETIPFDDRVVAREELEALACT
jgi:UDP-N-acetylmuramoyl-L-alanyl-D-glutamate--2,6-diaminopimelate ligase